MPTPKVFCLQGSRDPSKLPALQAPQTMPAETRQDGMPAGSLLLWQDREEAKIIYREDEAENRFHCRPGDLQHAIGNRRTTVR